MLKRRTLSLLIVLLLLIAGAAVVVAMHTRSNGNALWQIVSGKCLPGQRQNGDPAPCTRVDIQQGYALMKDRNGVLQYLLMPLAKITGIESPLLLNATTADFFTLAWQSRAQLSALHGAPIDDRALSLTINSEYGRTQNQLHIHISCLRPDVRQTLDGLTPMLSARWQTVTLRQHAYQIRTLTPAELTQESLFIRVADEIAGARAAMGKYGLALAALGDGRLVVMAVERDWLRLNQASAEELQDHSCSILPR